MTPAEIAAMVDDADDWFRVNGNHPVRGDELAKHVRALAAELTAHKGALHEESLESDQWQLRCNALESQLEAVTTERDRYKAALERIAENGTHHDLTPTKKMWGADRKPLDEANEIWWHAWIKRMDEQVKTIAREALKGAGQ